MDLIGKQMLKGTMEKQIKKLSGDNEAEASCEADDGISNEDKQRLQEEMNEKTEKMVKFQTKRRADRARTREEIRQKHNLKPNENDQKIIEESSGFSLFKSDHPDGTNGVQQAASAVLEKMRNTWGNMKEIFNET